jgi:hypothetical protein
VERLGSSSDRYTPATLLRIVNSKNHGKKHHDEMQHAAARRYLQQKQQRHM